MTLSRVSMLKSLEKLPCNTSTMSKLNSTGKSLVMFYKTQSSMCESKILELEESLIDEPMRTLTIGKKLITLHSIGCNHFHKKKCQKVKKKKRKIPFNERKVSMMASFKLPPKVANALRAKLKSFILESKVGSIFEIFESSDGCKKQLLPIAEEFNKFVKMIITHYYNEEELFEYERDIISEIRKSISGVNKVVSQKIEEISSEEFIKADLQAKFMLLKKILKLLSVTKPSKSKLVSKIILFHFLRNPLITNLVYEVFEKSQNEELVASTKNNAEYVFDFLYKNVEFFSFSTEFVRKFIEFYFEYELKKQKIYTRTVRGNKFRGNEPNTSKDIIKGILEKTNGDIFYTEWNKKEILHGYLFLQKGDFYKGGFKNKRPHGQGYRQNKEGTIYDGSWNNGYFEEGYQRLAYSPDQFGEIMDSETLRTGVAIYQKIDQSLIESHKKKEVLEKTLKTQGDPGTYIGQFHEECRSGNGTMYYTDGGVYIGEWDDDRINGQGVHYGVNNEKYFGEWLYGTYNGHGEKVYENGDHYVGEWKMGMMHGQGVLVKADGKVFDGEWFEDKFGNDDKNVSQLIKKSFKKSGTLKNVVSAFNNIIESV